MAEMKETLVRIPCRASFVNVDEPKGYKGNTPKYSLSALIPKEDKKTLLAIHKAVEVAKEEGRVKLWGGKIPNGLKLPLRDGDGDSNQEEYQGHFFVNCTNQRKPKIVDRSKHEVHDEGYIYSGCYVNVSVNFYPYNNNGSRGVSASLRGVQFVADGEAFGGSVNIDAEFDVLDDEDVLGADVSADELPDYLK